jgi:Trehalose utilisation/Ricin-type beta-trefoil lectin domain
MNAHHGRNAIEEFRRPWDSGTLRALIRWLAISALVLGFAASPALGGGKASAAPTFKVLAFYDSVENDAAHASFVHEAKQWFPQVAADNGFSWTATDDWSQVNTSTLSQYQVVMFLDDFPHSANQQSAFQSYMNNGGAWMGFHVSAFNTDPQTWSWYHNTFLGTGAFETNSWGPTSTTLRIEDATHPATAGLPGTITSSVSEWYSWANDLRENPDIDILASVDPSGFPVGTDPGQTWHSGYYPLVWTNKNYKMLYANFGHNAMDYGNNTTLSLTFSSPQQNQLVVDGLKWLGGDTSAAAPVSPVSGSTWYSLSNAATGKCVDARSAASTDGTAIQQYTCNNSTAQQFQVQATSGGYSRIDNRNNSAEALDVTDVSTADGAPIQLWTYSGGSNQQWQAVSEGTSRTYHFVNRNSGRCLSAASNSTADSVQLVQRACNNSTLQSFRLLPQT